MDKRNRHLRNVSAGKKIAITDNQDKPYVQRLSEIQSILDFRPGENSVGKVLERIRLESRDEVEKGHWFENLVARVLKDNPQYEILEIYRWSEWPEREELTGLDGRDIGIDLVAKRNFGDWIAIQCKCYEESRTVGKKDIDSFIAASQRKPFDLRFIIATCKWSRTAEAEIERLSLPLRRIDFLEHFADPISEKVAERPVRQLWPLQHQAVEDVVAGLHNHDRGRLIMACGTGKTFVSLRIAERIVENGGRILFLAPSIALVSQTRREWLRHTTRNLKCLVVCSDSSAGGRGENKHAFRVSELECGVTADPSEIANILQSEEGITRVIFCTYQSLRHVTKAQFENNAPAFDLAIMDEAHRTTGVDKKASGIAEERQFQAIHHDSEIRSAKRLYMTATPRIYKESSRRGLKKRNIETVDMSDFDVYGPELHRLSFKKAVNAGLLSDYRVIALGVRRDAATPRMRQTLVKLGEEQSSGRGSLLVTDKDITRLLGTSLAINGMTEGKDSDKPIRLHRIITFANTIARSKFFAVGMALPQVLSATTRRIRSTRTDADAAMKVESQHLDASNSALERNKALRELKSADKDRVARILCNVKLFGEGVDVPSLDAIVFMEPRDSQIDVVQAVGRVMRRSEGKRFGYIVVPISIDSGKGIADALAEGSDGYNTLGKVLRALQSHDERLAEDPLQFVKVHDCKRRIGGNTEKGDEQTELVLKLSDVSNDVFAHVIAASGLGNPGYQASLDIEYVVRRVARNFEDGQFEHEIANVLALAVEGGAKNLCTIAALLIANACLLHRRLCDLPDLEFLPTLNKIGGSGNPRNILREAWQAILGRDYRPVFEPALAVLDVLPERKLIGDSLRILAEWANQIADSLSELGYDHAGPLYHRILPSAEADGAFYTNNISALMLARLALEDEFIEWSDSDAIHGLRVIDPACGTGTLLMAVIHTIKSRIDRLQSLDEDQKKEFHRMLVENVICGLDINRHAIQLAACNLTLGAPTVDYNRMNLFTLKHGPQPDGSVQSGSLEILETTEQPHSVHALARPLRNMSGIQAEHVDKVEKQEFPLEGIDLVIMNPPFTNNEKRNQQYGKDVVKRLRLREQEIRKNLVQQSPYYSDVVNSNSIRTFFTPIADRLLHQERGTLAKVLPSTACTAVSGECERKFLANHFHIAMIVTSHDPKRINFSENTSIHECLMIARRKFVGSQQPTLFVSLAKMPNTPEEASAVTDAIVRGGGSSIFKWGRMIKWPSNLMKAGNWTPVQWYSEELVKAAYELENSVCLEPIGLHHEIGPSGGAIRAAFKKSTKSQNGSIKGFWSISSKLRQTMQCIPEQYAQFKPEKVHLAERYWNKRSHVLLAERYRTTNSRLSALWSASASVGSGWTPVAVDNESRAKALVAWCNSTPTMLMLLNRRSKTLTYPSWSLKQLRSVGVPKHDTPVWETLADAWEEVCNVEMLPLKDAKNCLARKVIDRAAAEALDIEESRIANWRRLLSKEPTVTNKPAQMD